MVQQIQNCLPSDILSSVTTYLKNANWKYGWRSNLSANIYPHWNFDISNTGPENGLDISHKVTGPASAVWRHLQSTYFPDTVLLRCYANSHTYGVEGYPHTDSKRDQDSTVVIYLNENWKREWAGETVIFNGDTIEHAELPKYNNALVFKGNKPHVARGVTRICPEQRITLMFKFAPIGADVVRDSLQTFLTNLGTGSVQHKNKTFLTHLLNTYDYLKSTGASDTVCKAGATHSIFGTNAFTKQTLTLDNRSTLVDNIGEESARLVELFSTVNRPVALEQALANSTLTLELTAGGTVDVDAETLNNLCMIECANLHDQTELKKYPQLEKMWANVYKLEN